MILEIGLVIFYFALVALTISFCIMGVFLIKEGWESGIIFIVGGSILFALGLGLTLVLISPILKVL